jgi:hypothetical protein
MNCYLCLIEIGCGDQTAYALCQRCGAGMCGRHLRELCFLPAAGMMDAHPTAKYSLICQRCYQAVAPSTRPLQKNMQRTQNPSLREFWRICFRRRTSPPLPTETEAVILAEQFLKHERNR